MRIRDATTGKAETFPWRGRTERHPGDVLLHEECGYTHIVIQIRERRQPTTRETLPTSTSPGEPGAVHGRAGERVVVGDDRPGLAVRPSLEFGFLAGGVLALAGDPEIDGGVLASGRILAPTHDATPAFVARKLYVSRYTIRASQVGVFQGADRRFRPDIFCLQSGRRE